MAPGICDTVNSALPFQMGIWPVFKCPERWVPVSTPFLSPANGRTLSSLPGRGQEGPCGCPSRPDGSVSRSLGRVFL